MQIPAFQRCAILAVNNEFITAFATVFFIYALGFAVQRIRPMGEGTLSDLSLLVIDILLPFYVFYTTTQNATIDAIVQSPIALVAGVVIPCISMFIAPLLYKPLRVPEKRQTAFTFSILFANTAFLGIPVCEALFGSEGAFYAVIYDFGLTMVGFTLGIWLLSGGKFGDWKKIFINPLLISVVLGLIVSATGVKFPVWLTEPLSTVGKATLPIALLVAGAQIGNLRFTKSALSRDLVGVVLLRLIIVPLVILGIFLISGASGLPKSVIIMEAAMPVAVSTTIVTRRYGADAQFAASATLFSTIFAMITLPLMAILVLSIK